MSKHTPGCPAPAYFGLREKVVYEDSRIRLTIGDIKTTSIKGIETNHGWGLKLDNKRGNPNKAYCFAFCPWCGAAVAEAEAEA